MDYIELLRSFGEGHGPDGILRTTTGILPVLGRTPKMNVCSRKSTSFLLQSHLIYWRTPERRLYGGEEWCGDSCR